MLSLNCVATRSRKKQTTTTSKPDAFQDDFQPCLVGPGQRVAEALRRREAKALAEDFPSVVIAKSNQEAV